MRQIQPTCPTRVKDALKTSYQFQSPSLHCFVEADNIPIPDEVFEVSQLRDQQVRLLIDLLE